MTHKKILAPAAVLLASAGALAVAPVALASQPKVNIRVEGKNRTLLPATPEAGSRVAVRKAGHSCSGETVAGAFNRAVHGDWGATWFTGLGFDVNRILGETADYTKTKRYYELFVDNKVASGGICSLRIVRGEQILFASVPDSGTVYPLGLRVARTARAGHPVSVTALAYNAAGRAAPLAGARLTVGRRTVTTPSSGTVRLTIADTGRYRVRVSKAGFIRDEATLKVVR